MPDDKTKKIPQDASKIDIKDSGEVAYWCSALGVTKSQLEDAVKVAGVTVAAVRKHLGK